MNTRDDEIPSEAVLVEKIRLYLDETALIDSDELGDEIADELWALEFDRQVANGVLAAATDPFGAFDLGWCICLSRRRRRGSRP